MKNKKLLSLVLSIVMLIPTLCLPLNASAAEIDYVYSESYNSEDIKLIEPSGAVSNVSVDSNAVTTLRNALRSHETQSVVKIPFPSVPVTTVSVNVKLDKPSDSEYCREYMRTLFYKAVEHTGNPIEGDYILRQMSEYECSVESQANGKSKHTYKVTFFTNKEKEDELNKTVDTILKSLNLNGKSDYQKIKAIYDYLCTNVTYHNLDFLVAMSTNAYIYFPTAHSAYGALQNNSAVCQGYAVAFYRLALSAGIDSRVIFGTASGGGHAWNIVKLDGKYYLLDSTWDAGQSEYKYFLKSEKDFPDHIPDDEHKTASWKSSYPISATSYTASAKAPVYDTIGDVDGDGSITAADSLSVLRISVKLETTSHTKLADVDGNGSIDSADALDILRYSVHLSANSNIGKKIK